MLGYPLWMPISPISGDFEGSSAHLAPRPTWVPKPYQRTAPDVFDNLAKRFSSIFSGLGSGKLTEKNIDEGIREVRQALLEADVNLQVVKSFIDRVREKAVGIKTIKDVRPADQFVKIVKDEMVQLLGGDEGEVRTKWSSKGPTVIMMVGLQGTGKTTTTAKIARHLKRKEMKKPLLVAADVQRPAAIEQLKILGEQLEIPVHAEAGGRPPKICKRGVKRAAELGCDVVLLDTAGRLHIDAELMDELEDIRDAVKPEEIWLVVDAMLGQDAVTSASEFNQRLDVSGIILTKTDGDARGGAALAVREVTGKTIRYVGTGEKLDKLERFVPERMAGRILGMGDVVGLVEQAQEVVDQAEAQAAAERLVRDRFTLDDMMMLYERIGKMGNVKDLMAKLPGGAAMVGQAGDDMPDNKDFTRYRAVIQSMTRRERFDPKIIHMQRRHRIARGCGQPVGAVNEVLKMHKAMRQQMKTLKKNGLVGRVAAGAMKRQKNKRMKKLKKEGADFRGWFK